MSEHVHEAGGDGLSFGVYLGAGSQLTMRTYIADVVPVDGNITRNAAVVDAASAGGSCAK